jgi:phospholipase/carboxylesterase
MLHGWLGNEDVMWVFGRKIPESIAVFAPRATHGTSAGGYSWVKDRAEGRYSSLEDLSPAAEAIDNLLESLAGRFAGDFSRVHVMGFSQGAALAYSWAALSHRRVRSLAALAGFPPEGLEASLSANAWSGLPVLVAHGREDTTVPIGMAEDALRIARSAGARASLCIDDVGHKLGSSCMRALGDFYAEAL